MSIFNQTEIQYLLHHSSSRLFAAHDTREFPTVDVVGTRQSPARSLDVIEKNPVFIRSSLLGDFRCVVHTDVGCSAWVGVVLRHQVARVFFRPFLVNMTIWQESSVSMVDWPRDTRHMGCRCWARISR